MSPSRRPGRHVTCSGRDAIGERCTKRGDSVDLYSSEDNGTSSATRLAVACSCLEVQGWFCYSHAKEIKEQIGEVAINEELMRRTNRVQTRNSSGTQRRRWSVLEEDSHANIASPSSTPSQPKRGRLPGVDPPAALDAEEDCLGTPGSLPISQQFVPMPQRQTHVSRPAQWHMERYDNMLKEKNALITELKTQLAANAAAQHTVGQHTPQVAPEGGAEGHGGGAKYPCTVEKLLEYGMLVWRAMNTIKEELARDRPFVGENFENAYNTWSTNAPLSFLELVSDGFPGFRAQDCMYQHITTWSRNGQVKSADGFQYLPKVAYLWKDIRMSSKQAARIGLGTNDTGTTCVRQKFLETNLNIPSIRALDKRYPTPSHELGVDSEAIAWLAERGVKTRITIADETDISVSDVTTSDGLPACNVTVADLMPSEFADKLSDKYSDAKLLAWYKDGTDEAKSLLDASPSRSQVKRFLSARTVSLRELATSLSAEAVEVEAKLQKYIDSTLTPQQEAARRTTIARRTERVIDLQTAAERTSHLSSITEVFSGDVSVRYADAKDDVTSVLSTYVHTFQLIYKLLQRRASHVLAIVATDLEARYSRRVATFATDAMFPKSDLQAVLDFVHAQVPDDVFSVTVDGAFACLTQHTGSTSRDVGKEASEWMDEKRRDAIEAWRLQEPASRPLQAQAVKFALVECVEAEIAALEPPLSEKFEVLVTKAYTSPSFDELTTTRHHHEACLKYISGEADEEAFYLRARFRASQSSRTSLASWLACLRSAVTSKDVTPAQFSEHIATLKYLILLAGKPEDFLENLFDATGKEARPRVHQGTGHKSKNWWQQVLRQKEVVQPPATDSADTLLSKTELLAACDAAIRELTEMGTEGDDQMSRRIDAACTARAALAEATIDTQSTVLCEALLLNRDIHKHLPNEISRETIAHMADAHAAFLASGLSDTWRSCALRRWRTELVDRVIGDAVFFPRGITAARFKGFTAPFVWAWLVNIHSRDHVKQRAESAGEAFTEAAFCEDVIEQRFGALVNRTGWKGTLPAALRGLASAEFVLMLRHGSAEANGVHHPVYRSCSSSGRCTLGRVTSWNDERLLVDGVVDEAKWLDLVIEKARLARQHLNCSARTTIRQRNFKGKGATS